MDTSLTLYYGFGITAVLAAAVFGYKISTKSKKKIPDWFLYALIGLSGYVFVAQYLKFQSLHMYVDVTHWLQIVKSIADVGMPYSLNHEFIFPGTFNYFSVHFAPLIYVFGVLYKIISFPETLLFFNTAFMLSAAIPLYLLGKRHEDRAFGIFVAVLLLWHPTFQYITLYEFEMLRFSIPILLWALYFFEKKKTFLFYVFILLAALVREEVGLTVGFFGLYLALIQRVKKHGWSVVILGFGSFALITEVVMPAFSTASEFSHIAAFSSFSQFGATPVEMVINIVLHPLIVLQQVWQLIKFANLFMLFLPLAFVPLLSPTALIAILGNIGTGFVSDSITHSSYMLYYIAPSVPFIFYALVKVWPKLIRVLGRVSQTEVERVQTGAMNAVLIVVIVSNIFFGPSPVSLQFWFKNIRPAPFHTQDFHWSVYRVTDHHKKVDAFADMIPDDAIVSAPQFLHPRLYKKRGAMVFPRIVSKDGSFKAEYILIDRTNNGLKPESPAFVDEQEFSIIEQDGSWKIVASDDGYELYRQTL